MLVFYRVIYHTDRFIKVKDFNFFFEALDFAKEIRLLGGSANIRKIPMK